MANLLKDIHRDVFEKTYPGVYDTLDLSTMSDKKGNSYYFYHEGNLSSGQLKVGIFNQEKHMKSLHDIAEKALESTPVYKKLSALMNSHAGAPAVSGSIDFVGSAIIPNEVSKK